MGPKKAVTLQTGMVRQDTQATSISSLGGNCIQGYINYVQTKGEIKRIQKWADTDVNTVVENLIEVMIMKGYTKISLTGINLMKSDIDKPKFTRTQMFNYIAGFANKPNSMPTSNARDELTVSNSDLVKSTQAADTSYVGRNYGDIPATVLPTDLSPAEILLASRVKYGKDDDLYEVISGKKKVCSTCWICNKNVHVYELVIDLKKKKTKTSKLTVYISCGQDEHVSPPGVGNLFGLLYPEIAEQIAAIQAPGAGKYSLRSSHDWCNQVKSDYNLISPPSGSSDTYKINSSSLNLIMTKAEEWLDKHATNRVDIDITFHTDLDASAKTAFLTNMRTTMTNYLGNLCAAFNSNSSLSVPSTSSLNNPYTSYTLRLIFFSCVIGCQVLFKNINAFQKSWQNMTVKKKGGSNKTQYGGLNFSDEDLQYYSHEEQHIIDDAFNQIIGNEKNIKRCIDDVGLNRMEEDLKISDIVEIHGEADDLSLTINRLSTIAEEEASIAKINKINVEIGIISNLRPSEERISRVADLNRQKNAIADQMRYIVSQKSAIASQMRDIVSQKSAIASQPPVSRQTMSELIDPNYQPPVSRQTMSELIDPNYQPQCQPEDCNKGYLSSMYSAAYNCFCPTKEKSSGGNFKNNKTRKLRSRVRKSKVRKSRVKKIKVRKSRVRKSRLRKIKGGNNIGGNCSDPNFSIYSTNMLKLFPYKGGKLNLNDPYKNNEGPQY